MKGYAAIRTGGLRFYGLPASITDVDVRTAVLPSVAVFPLLQHTGTPAECVVSPGDRVREGMMIASASGRVSSAVHSSIPGVVISRRSLPLPNGERSEAVVVKLEGAFERLGRSPMSAAEGVEMQREELLARIEENGLVSLDSRAFPLHLLWRIPRGKRVDRLIVSALDDEPMMTVESRLSRDRREALAEGLAVAVRILEPRSIDFVHERSAGGPPENLSALRDVAQAAGIAFSQSVLPARYPRGEHRDVVRAVTGLRIPAGQRLSDLGLLVTNVSTLVAVRDAVLGGKPLIERYVTVGGAAVREPSILRVRIGTRVRDLIEECGGFSEVPERVVLGGPLTGSVIYDLETPVMKGTAAILALTKREVGRRTAAPCISCGRCVTVCPEELNPIALYRDIEEGRLSDSVKKGLMSCSTCGSCSYVCPSHIPLLDGLRAGRFAAWAGEGSE